MISLSHRERILAAVVGGIAFVFANVFLINLFLEKRAELQRQIQSKSLELKAMQGLVSQKARWNERDEWLRATQPKLGSEDAAGVQLLNQIRDAARRSQVLLDRPAISLPDRRGEYVSVSVELETKSSWRAILEFLHELQQPDQFIVFENASLKVDDADHAQMRGHFKIARWHAASTFAVNTP